MSSAEDNISHHVADSLAALHCVKCHGPLRIPVQLPACLHILCASCERGLEAAFTNNIYCPKCNTENARPHVLNRISGVNENVMGNLPCDNDPSHSSAVWSCFICARNLCSACRAEHPRGHELLLLSQQVELDTAIFGERDTRNISASQQAEMIDSSTPTSLRVPKCPICKVGQCKHTECLSKMRESAPIVDVCTVSGHVDGTGKPLQLSYFCRVCKKFICGDCSHKGEHKFHKTYEMDTLKAHLSRALKILQRDLKNIAQNCAADIEDKMEIEERLREHTEVMTRELKDRRYRVLEETTYAFNHALHDAESKGKDILDTYKAKLNEIVQYKDFLNDADSAIQADQDIGLQDNTDVLRAFERKERAEELLADIKEQLKQISKPEEQRLVLPNVATKRLPPPSLARVGKEFKQLKLAFTINLRPDNTDNKNTDILFAHDIVVTDNKSCLLSCQLSSEGDHDAIFAISHEHETCRPIQVDVTRGTYHMARLKSNEIVVSFNSRKDEDNAMQYCDGDIFKQTADSPKEKKYGRKATFKTIRSFDVPPKGIAATKDNNILICAGAPSKKGESYLVLMSLQGKVLKEETRASLNLLSPDYVAVSDSGEICISDTEGSSIVIVSENLEVKERLNLHLPSSLSHASYMTRDENVSNYVFQPYGICYDTYERIIVADQRNDAVLRLMRDTETGRLKMEPLLNRTSESDNSEMNEFKSPRLVAMGPDKKLWVVCSNKIFVFDYCL